jgi:branched-chain amino acid transport system substrate-binding protein
MTAPSIRSLPQNQDNFDRRLYNLPHQRKEVLKLYLQWQKYLINSEDSESENTTGVFRSQKELDCKIAKKLEINTVTVRTHILNARIFFGLKDNEPYPRQKLVELFYKYKRDWIEPYDLVQSSSNFYLIAGTSYFDRQKYREAIKLFKKAIDGDCADPIAQICLNNAEARQKSNPFKIAVVVAYFRNDFHINAADNVLRGIADAQTKFNQNNGKDGRLLEIVIANDDNQPLVAMEVAKYLALDRNIVAVIGHHSSESTKAVLDIYKKASIPIVSPTSTSSTIRSDNFFRTIGSTNAIANKYVGYVKDYLNLDEIAIFYHKNNEYSQTLKENFTTAFQHRGGRFIELIFDLSDSSLDIEKSLQEIKTDAKVKAALVISSIETNCVAIAIARKNAELTNIELLFVTSLPESSILKKGGSAIEGVAFISPNLATKSAYIKDAKDRWQQDINWRIATAHDAVQVLIQAILSSKDPTRASVLNNLQTVDLSSTLKEYCISKICNNQFKEIY